MTGKLFAVERIKTMNYTSFRIIMILFSGLVVLGYYVAGSFGTVTIDGDEVVLPELMIYDFPGTWHYLTYISGFLHYLPALLIILLVTNDIQYGLWKQHIAEGMDRGELVGAKLLVISLISAYATVLLMVTGLVYGLSYTEEVSFQLILKNAGFLAGYLVQIFAYMTMAFVFALVCKRAGLAITLLLVYALIGERLIRFFLPEELSFYFPMAAFSGIIGNPFMSLIGVEVADTPFINNFYVSLAWIAVLLAGSYAFVRYKEV